MKTTKITQTEMEPMLIASLPTRPTAPGAFGGNGYTASQMKEAFDKLPTHIVDRLNSLIDDITSGDVCDAIPTGIEGAPVLAELLGAFVSGTLASLIKFRDTTLTAYLETLRADVDRLISMAEGEAAE